MEEILTAHDDESQPKPESLPSTNAGMITSISKKGRILALISAMRPQQWPKNLALFVGIVFSQKLFSPILFERATIAFAVFCLASSSIYLLNDLLDMENDRQHPVKRNRPLASGRLSVLWAVIAVSILILFCMAFTFLIFNIPINLDHQSGLIASPGTANLLFALIVASYLILMVLYSTHLKHIVLLDVFIIAGGFALRILAGTVVIAVSISPWLYLVTILLSLFLALSKRRHELVILQEQARNHRQILKEYSIPLLDQLITIVTAATLIAYSLYTFQGPTGNHRLMVTIPLVLYGMFRYLYLVYMHKEGGSPEEVLLRDRHMLGTVLLCTVIIILVLYILPQ